MVQFMGKWATPLKALVVIVLFLIGGYITSTTHSAATLPEGFVSAEPDAPGMRKTGGNVGGGVGGNVGGGTDSTEGFENNNNSMEAITGQRCPNILIQHGTDIFLYNSKVAKVPGVNPIRFKNLEDYSEFMDWLRGRGIRCPVLYLQYSYDTQGNPVYKMRPSPLDLQGGLSPNVPYSSAPGALVQLMDASRDNPPFNNEMYAGFDPLNFNMGDNTPLDAQFRQKEISMTYSDNAMDANWGGERYSQAVVDSGAYADRTRPDGKSNTSSLTPMRPGGASEKYRSARYAGDAVSLGHGVDKQWGSALPVQPSSHFFA